MSGRRSDDDPGITAFRASRWIAPLLALMLTVVPNPAARAGADGPPPPSDATRVALPVPPPPPPEDGADVDQGKGLTLDEAVERLLRENLTLRALKLEVPQARADVLAAGEPPKSWLFVSDRGNGPRFVRRQPWDLIPKRWARVLTARLAAGVTEAQYRDAVRLQTDDLSTAFVNVQAAQQQVRFARTFSTGVEKLLKMMRLFADRGQAANADVNRAVAEQERAAGALADAEAALALVKLTLADLLNMTDAEADRLEVVDLSDENPPDPPPIEELIRRARRRRPDLLAYRLGLLRAQSAWLQTWVEQFPDVEAQFATDRHVVKAVGGGVIAPQNVPDLLFSLPDVGHHRGKIERARINVEQSRIELAQADREVALSVRRAHLEHRNSLDQVRRLKDKILPSARQVRDDAFRRFQGGEIDLPGYLSAQQDYNDVVRRYSDARTRQRRNTLALNTAVGERVLP